MRLADCSALGTWAGEALLAGLSNIYIYIYIASYLTDLQCDNVAIFERSDLLGEYSSLYLHNGVWLRAGEIPGTRSDGGCNNSLQGVRSDRLDVGFL